MRSKHSKHSKHNKNIQAKIKATLLVYPRNNKNLKNLDTAESLGRLASEKT